MCGLIIICFCFKQKTAYEMRISDWSSDVCSSDLMARVIPNELLSLMLDVGGKVIADAEPDPADTSIHQMQTGVFFNTSGTTSGADVSGNTFDYITQDAIRFHRAILECNVSHNICKGYNSSASASFAPLNKHGRPPW